MANVSSHRSPHEDLPEVPDFGVGDQVIIKHDSRDGSRDWVGEPSGEIVAAAEEQGWAWVVGEMSADFPWIVVFDEPQYLKDGTGPFERTAVAAWRLIPAPTSQIGVPELSPAP